MTKSSEVKVKAYGLIMLTKKQYLAIQSAVFVILALCVAVSQWYDLSASDEFILKHFRTLCIIIFVLEFLEVLFMLNAFKKKNAQCIDSRSKPRADD